MDSVTARRAVRKTWFVCLSIGLSLLVAAPAIGAPPASAVPPADAGLRTGDRVDLGGRTASVLLLDTLPYVENKVTQKFIFDRFGDAALDQLRVQCRLDDVAAPGRNEFERQALLMEWVNAQIEYGDPTAAGKGKVREPLDILRLAGQEQKLYCENFAALLIASAASMGYVCRPVDIPTHSFDEMWSSQFGRWVMMDPTGHFWGEKDGLPLNIYEIRKEWFADKCKSVSFFKGRDRRHSSGRSFEPYWILYYTLKRDWLGNRPAGGALVTKDEISKGRGTDRDLLANPATDPYFPMNQASLTLTPRGAGLQVRMRTLTPNFKTYRVRIDGGAWTDSNDLYTWTPHDGLNVLEAESVNLFDVAGPVSTVELNVAKGAGTEIVLPACSLAAEGGGKVRTRDAGGDMTPAYVHLWSTRGHWLEWDIADARGGQYNVWITYATRFHPKRQLAVNGQRAAGLETFSMGPTGGWAAFGDSRLPAKVTLKDGSNVLRLTCLDDSSMAVSAIRLTAPDRKDILIDGASLARQGGHGEGAAGAAKVVYSPHGYFRQWDANGHWLEWTVEAAAAGPHDMYLRYATMYDAPRQVLVNGEAAKGLEKFSLPLTDGWNYWEEAKLPAPVVLKQGKNVLRMLSLGGERGGGLNVSGIRLAAPGGKDTLVDAVHYTGQGGGGVQVYAPSRHRSFNGWDAKGHWLEYAVRSDKEADYTLTLHCGSGEKSAREVRVNGEVAKGLESAAIEATGSWQMWKDVTLPAKVHLKKGDNVLRLTAVSGGLNLDEIRLTPVD